MILHKNGKFETIRVCFFFYSFFMVYHKKSKRIK